MPTQAIAGYSALLYVSTDGGGTYNKFGEAKDITLSIKRAAVDATSHDSAGWKESILGVAEWSAKTDALYVDGDAAQDAVRNALVNGTALKLRLLPKTGAGLDKYEGSCMITDWELSGPNTDAAAISATFQGNGALAASTQ